MNKKVFTVKLDDKEVELAILKPTAKIRINAQLIYNKAWAEAEKAGSPIARNLDDLAKKHGVWDENTLTRISEMEAEMISLEKKLRGGANTLASREEGRKVALQLRKLRNDRFDLLRSRDDLYVYTAENHAENARIHYFVSQCCVYNDTGKPFYKSYEDFVDNSESDVAKEVLTAYFQLLREDIPDEKNTFYENIFLKKYGYVNDDYHLIDEQGRLVTEDGKLVDSEGRYVDEQGRYVDRYGNLIDKDGNYLIHFSEFTD